MDELLLQFDDVPHAARARLADGSIEGDDSRLLLKVNEKVDCVNARPDSFRSDGALEAVAEWRELRMAAGEVEATLEKSWNLNSRDQG
ncbi:hypothetical protein [Frankia nepalensis]|uniref:Uncharacterized protein n=1 Tax=Frankia nepalensis TaxID=1836974 RepID=A0A937RB30_9ACTN|nr:hypothetical protein [Frankia nepalensis]MBL7499457.1 hypothetical protein [Frankia nepalensis]MBL7516089.1 hypothetical protein [Frankia nepalensis]MBL7625639.1 hypothetical protein [Frankia nepalensis]